MNSKQTLIGSILLAASTLSAPAFAAGDASQTWVQYREARGLPTSPKPSVPYVLPIPTLVEMAVTDGDTDRAAIARRFEAQYAIGKRGTNGRGNGNGNGNGNGGNGHGDVSCDKATKDLLSNLARSEGYRDGDNIGCFPD